MMARDERSLGELFAELSSETSTLVRQEVQLAKAELSHKASEVGKDVGYLAAGAAVLYAGMLAILAGLILLLGQLDFIAMWFSALLIGIIVAAIGYFLVRRGLKDLKQTPLAPQHTIETLKEDKEWAKEQTR